MTTQPVAELERKTIARVMWRLLPLIMCSYFIAYVDRTNVSFAALTMNKDIGLSPYVFGWGAGIFFLGYFLFEVPSNIMLEKVGARLWIARIMVTWGIVAGLMAAVTGPASFISMRFLLGVAEAGFFPGMILYFTYWFPSRYRARVIGYLFMAVPISNGLGAAVSGLLLELNGVLGLKGWQWMYILEALPAILLGFVVLFVLPDRPKTAGWLSAEQKSWLEGELEAERKVLIARGQPKLLKALVDWRVLVLCLLYLLTTSANYGLTFFMPQVLKGLGQSNMMTGFMAAVPYLLGMIGLVVFGWSSDRYNERRWHFAVTCGLGALGLAGAAFTNGSYAQLAMMTLATIGIYGSRPPFWPMPSNFLTGTAAAAGIAIINSVGNLGGYFGPFAVGWIRQSTNSFEPALYTLSVLILLAGIVAILVPAVAGAKKKPTGIAGGGYETQGVGIGS
jgi:MFS transporter, ACS family, tartrate transporter